MVFEKYFQQYLDCPHTNSGITSDTFNHNYEGSHVSYIYCFYGQKSIVTINHLSI